MDKLIYQGPPKRIDQYLTTQFPYSRNFFHHIIKRGAVLVMRSTCTTQNNQATSEDIPPTAQPVKKSYKLQAGDTIYVESLERFIDGGILEEAPQRDLDIRHETQDYMVIHKPKGVLSHPNSVWDIEHKSVVGGVYHYLKGQGVPSMGSFVRAGLVHRLDKETDGLMIIAKTEKGLQHFKALFQRKSAAATLEEKEAVPLKKRYQATCIKTPTGMAFLDSIRNQLPHTIISMVHAKVPHSIPKEGITKIMEILEESETHSTLLLEILTGRTHQIRVHLSEHGLPILGDYLYGEEDESGMQLSAVKLEFEEISGKVYKLE